MRSEDYYNDPMEDGNSKQDFSYALEVYKRACEEGSERSLAFSEEEFIYIIESLINEDDEANVLKASEIAFKQHSYSSELLVKLVDSMLLMGKTDAAVEILDDYKDSFPQNPDVSLLYCRASIALGAFEKAKEYFAEMMANERDSVCSAEAAAALAQDCIDNNQFADAVYYLMESNKIMPLSFEYYNDLAFCYERMGEFKLSEKYYNLYLDRDPFNDNVWFNIGTVYARQGDMEKAIDAFEYSIALNKENSSSLYNLAVVYLNLEKYEESARYFEEFNECEKDSLAGVLGLANAYMGCREFAKAIDMFSKAKKIDQKCGEAYLGIEVCQAMELYLKGDRGAFFSLMDYIIKRDITWINTIRRVIPQLNSDTEFIDYMESKLKRK